MGIPRIAKAMEDLPAAYARSWKALRESIGARCRNSASLNWIVTLYPPQSCAARKGRLGAVGLNEKEVMDQLSEELNVPGNVLGIGR
jgi:hypothetical protein